jgi:hypothetical protein
MSTLYAYTIQVCTVAVGVCGDLCRALESHILTYSDDIVRCLLQCLQNTGINRYNIKLTVYYNAAHCSSNVLICCTVVLLTLLVDCALSMTYGFRVR